MSSAFRRALPSRFIEGYLRARRLSNLAGNEGFIALYLRNARPCPMRSAPVVLAGYSPRLLLASHSRLVAAGSGQNKCGPTEGRLIGRSCVTQELFRGGLSGNELTIPHASTLLHYLVKNPLSCYRRFVNCRRLTLESINFNRPSVQRKSTSRFSAEKKLYQKLNNINMLI